jgi:hypothetical protein
MKGFDRRSLLAGIIAGFFFALPAAVVQRAVGSDSIVSNIMLAVIFFSGALAGFGAARPLPPSPLVHGAVAGAITLLGAQVVFSAWSATLPNPIALAFWLVSFGSLGTLGAWVAVWSAGNRSRPGPTRRTRP